MLVELYNIKNSNNPHETVRFRTALSAPSLFQPQHFGEQYVGTHLAFKFVGLIKFQAMEWVASPLDGGLMRNPIAEIDEYAVGWNGLIKSIRLIGHNPDLRSGFGNILCKAIPGQGPVAISDDSAKHYPSACGYTAIIRYRRLILWLR